jgi:hypothetical protein
MERGKTEVHRMNGTFPLQLGKGSKALSFEVGVRRSLPLRSGIFVFFRLRPSNG